MGIVMFLFVLVFLLLIGLLSLIPHSAAHQHAAVQSARNQPGPWFFAAMPLLEGIMGFLGTALFCWLYNRFTGFTGGIELNVERLSEAPAPSSPTTNT
jgi:hypothetical protein